MIRPDVQAEIDATRAAMARLRLAAGRVCLPTRRASKSSRMTGDARKVIALDDAYAAATGVVLNEETAPAFPQAHIESRYDWSVCVHPQAFPRRVFTGLDRLRAGQPGCHSVTAYAITVYFDAIWPDGAIWPSSVKRPTPVRRSYPA